MPPDSEEQEKRAELVRRLTEWLPELEAFLRTQIGDQLRRRETEADLAQSMCREALEQIDTRHFSSETDLRAWLFDRAKKKVLEKARFHYRLRRTLRREEASADDALAQACSNGLGARAQESPSQVAMLGEQLAEVRRALEMLSAEDRRILETSFQHGQQAIPLLARELARSTAAVRVLLHRARKRLRQQLGRRAPHPPDAQGS